jgi:hypothetical protein
MERNVFLGLGVATLVVVTLVVFALYRWQQRRRACHVAVWVKEFLRKSYGAVPNDLNINCSDDQLWPVLVGFREPGTGTRRDLQFSCHGPESAWFVDEKCRFPKKEEVDGNDGSANGSMIPRTTEGRSAGKPIA